MSALGQHDQDGTSEHGGSIPTRPTDFLAYSRQYATRMGLDPDVTSWRSEDFHDFLDWWLLGTMSRFSAGEDSA